MSPLCSQSSHAISQSVNRLSREMHISPKDKSPTIFVVKFHCCINGKSLFYHHVINKFVLSFIALLVIFSFDKITSKSCISWVAKIYDTYHYPYCDHKKSVCQYFSAINPYKGLSYHTGYAVWSFLIPTIFLCSIHSLHMVDANKIHRYLGFLWERISSPYMY